MLHLALLFIAQVSLLLPISAAADGKVFAPVAIAQPTIPDQSALIHYTNGVERLVIETRFAGAGTNFAWVVPLPAQPVIEVATSGLFPTLRVLTRPQVIHNVPRYYLGILAVLALVYLLRSVRPDQPLRWGHGLACVVICASALAANPFVGGFVSLMLITGVLMTRRGKEPVYIILVLVFIGGFLGALLVPSLGTSRAITISEEMGVSILERKLVGIFETTTIRSRDPDALRAWLTNNGYALPKSSEAVICSYVSNGWVFAAARLRQDKAGDELRTPHPLSFTFPTERAVYPMRLTGVENGPVTLDLFVFGPSRAAGSGLSARRCAQPRYPILPRDYQQRASDFIEICHPLLRSWVDGAPVLTHLAGRLTPSQMRDDIWLHWERYREREGTLYSKHGAGVRALNWGAATLVAGLILIGLFGGTRPARRYTHGRKAKLLLPLSIVVLLVVPAFYWALPKTEVQMLKMGFWSTYHGQQLPFVSMMGETNLSLAEARALLTQDIWKTQSPSERRNSYTGGLIHEEDSPGNYSFRESTNGVEYLIYDATGAGNVLGRL